jgi:hypothetical protein
MFFSGAQTQRIEECTFFVKGFRKLKNPKTRGRMTMASTGCEQR